MTELEGLEKEFVDYLIVNGITADEWVRIKSENKEKAEDIITLFSDVVFEGIMRKVSFMDQILPNEVRTFQCLKDKLVLVGMKTREATHDFTDPAFIQKAARQPPEGIEVFTSEKPYAGERERELFEMTQAGCTISDGRLFKALSLSLAP